MRTTAKLFEGFILLLIALNLIAVLLHTVKSLSSQNEAFFHGFELISIVLFTVEYIFRVWTCTIDPFKRFVGTIKGRLKFMLRPFLLLDLASILPFYYAFIQDGFSSVVFSHRLDLRMLRALRLFRVTIFFKDKRSWNSFKTFTKVLKQKRFQIYVFLQECLYPTLVIEIHHIMCVFVWCVFVWLLSRRMSRS